MAGTKTTGLTALTTVDESDVLMVVDISDTSMSATGTNKKVTRATLLRDNLYGWTPAESTWTYASATTFTTPGDVTSKYRKGGKIRWKQGGAYKYAYILSATYSDPSTTVTITGGSDYTMANSAITDNYVSYEVSPLEFPAYINWTPSYSASGSMTYGSVTTDIARFTLNGGLCTAQIQSHGTVGGTPSFALRASLPITASNRYAINGGGIGFDNGTSLGCVCGNLNTASTTVLDVYKITGANWTAGTAYIGIGVSYPIA